MKNNNFCATFDSSKNTSSCLTHSLPPQDSLKTKTRTVMTTLLYTFLYFLSFNTPIPMAAQVIHQSFEIGERKTINLNLDIPYEVEVWAGNTILTETKVRIENIPPSILKHFIDQGRYEVVETLTETSIDLKLKDIDRRPIRTKNGEADETTNIRIFVPENCTINHLGKGSLVAEFTGK